MLVAVAQPSRGQAFDEYQVKAAFLFNFAQFVQWADARGARDDPFVIGVLGDDPFDGYLDATVSGESVGGRPFVVERYRNVAEAARANILFVSRSESQRIGQIVEALRGKPVLTVSDADDFAKRGGMVQFVTANKRIKLSINLDRARASNLTISSKLLRPATIVSSEQG